MKEGKARLQKAGPPSPQLMAAELELSDVINSIGGKDRELLIHPAVAAATGVLARMLLARYKAVTPKDEHEAITEYVYGKVKTVCLSENITEFDERTIGRLEAIITFRGEDMDGRTKLIRRAARNLRDGGLCVTKSEADEIVKKMDADAAHFLPNEYKQGKR